MIIFVGGLISAGKPTIARNKQKGTSMIICNNNTDVAVDCLEGVIATASILAKKPEVHS